MQLEISSGSRSAPHFAVKFTLQLLFVSFSNDCDAGANVAPVAVGVTVKLEPPGIVQLQRCAFAQVAHCLVSAPSEIPKPDLPKISPPTSTLVVNVTSATLTAALGSLLSALPSSQSYPARLMLFSNAPKSLGTLMVRCHPFGVNPDELVRGT